MKNCNINVHCRQKGKDGVERCYNTLASTSKSAINVHSSSTGVPGGPPRGPRPGGVGAGVPKMLPMKDRGVWEGV